MRKFSQAFILVTLFSCAQSTTPIVTSIGNCANLNTKTNLVGNWSQACFSNGGTWVTDAFNFTGSNYTETVTTYSNSSCTTLVNTLVVTGTFAVGSALPTGMDGYSEIDFTISTMVMTPNTAAKATSLNTLASFNASCAPTNVTGYCGITTWASGTGTSMLGQNSCASACVFSAGQVMKQAFALGHSDGIIVNSCTTPINTLLFGSISGTITNGTIASSSGTVPSSVSLYVYSGP